MNKIVKTTSKGQITIPAALRKKYNTDSYIISDCDNKIILAPAKVMIKKIKRTSKRSKQNNPESIIFDADRDNKGKSIDASDLLAILREIDE